MTQHELCQIVSQQIYNDLMDKNFENLSNGYIHWAFKYLSLE